MVQKKKGRDGYKDFAASISDGQIGSFYIFHGDERYLLEHSLNRLRELLCPGGLDGFNYKRFDGSQTSAVGLEDAINTMPFFAEKTLIEVHDFDIFGSEQKPRLAEVFADLPDYVCIVFIFNTVQYKPDGRQKLNAAILKCAEVVEFTVQEQDKLVKWIVRHFQDAGKRISAADAEYLAFITGGFMSALSGEIEKVAAYSARDTVTRSDIDALVAPTLDTAVYKLADALIRREYSDAMRILDELLRMREAPHKLLFSISAKMRQLLAARIYVEDRQSRDDLMDTCGIKFEFQARLLMDTARKTTLARCRDAVLLCSDAAYRLNFSPEPENCLIELLAKLALRSG
ncbi:MAG: DNA polymerase III subunit delta [Oscillospiraceae bacterium]|jgi:DNA polymerase-3 subunit delta|nr:DNA polymerase III subunit delta [Oscillospiraceae bacterium]